MWVAYPNNALKTLQAGNPEISNLKNTPITGVSLENPHGVGFLFLLALPEKTKKTKTLPPWMFSRETPVVGTRVLVQVPVFAPLYYTI